MSTPFKPFADLVSKQIKDIFHKAETEGRVLRAGVTGGECWSVYLNAFPEGTNPMFRECTEHDCSCCKSFIRAVANAFWLDKDLSIHTIWDLAAASPQIGFYQVVAEEMRELVHGAACTHIYGLFRTKESGYGAAETTSKGETWNHFYFVTPRQYLVEDHETATSVAVFQRGLEEITPEAISTVQELIASDSIYRGAEFRPVVDSLAQHKRAYDKLQPDEKDRYAWLHGDLNTQHRGTVIGTLLVDLSEGNDVESCVGRYEAKTAPTNYKRSKSLIAQGMIDKARAKVEELGLEPSLHRR